MDEVKKYFSRLHRKRGDALVIFVMQAIAIVSVVTFYIICFIQPESGTVLNKLGWDLLLPFLFGSLVLAADGIILVFISFKKPTRTGVKLLSLGVLLFLLATWWLILGSLAPETAIRLSRFLNLSV